MIKKPLTKIKTVKVKKNLGGVMMNSPYIITNQSK